MNERNRKPQAFTLAEEGAPAQSRRKNIREPRNIPLSRIAFEEEPEQNERQRERDRKNPASPPEGGKRNSEIQGCHRRERQHRRARPPRTEDRRQGKPDQQRRSGEEHRSIRLAEECVRSEGSSPTAR